MEPMLIKTDSWCASCGNVGWLEKVDGTLLCSKCASKHRDDRRIRQEQLSKAIRKSLRLEADKNAKRY